MQDVGRWVKGCTGQPGAATKLDPQRVLSQRLDLASLACHLRLRAMCFGSKRVALQWNRDNCTTLGRGKRHRGGQAKFTPCPNESAKKRLTAGLTLREVFVASTGLVNSGLASRSRDKLVFLGLARPNTPLAVSLSRQLHKQLTNPRTNTSSSTARATPDATKSQWSGGIFTTVAGTRASFSRGGASEAGGSNQEVQLTKTQSTKCSCGTSGAKCCG